MPFGLIFSTLNRADLVEILRSKPVPPGKGARVVCTANLDHIVTLRSNTELQAAYRDAWCVTADGMPVFAYARLIGEHVPSRVTGADIVSDLIHQLPPETSRCLFVASCEDTAEGIRTLMLRRGFPADALAFVVPPFGFEKDKGRSDGLARHIRDHRATHVFFGVGAPKSEIWTHARRNKLGDCYVLNAGAGLDYACGVKRRAPAWMQRSGLEWVWRFLAEPKRLFRRYFVSSWGFLLAVAVDLSSARRLSSHQP